MALIPYFLAGATVISANTAPSMGKINVYSATAAPRTAALPALSGLNVGARLSVAKSMADTDSNPVTINCAGSDTYQDGVTAQLILTQPGQRRELQVISVSGTKYWVVMGGVNGLTEISPHTYEASTGEATLPRLIATNNAIATSGGSVLFAFFTARKTETISSVRLICGGTAATYGGSGLCRIGIYTEDSTGNLDALVASTANDTSLLIAASTLYAKTLSASFTKTAGKRYAVGICIAASTPPSVFGVSAVNVRRETEAGIGPRLAGFAAGSDLPATVAVGSFTSSSGIPYIALVP